jgi:peptidyl-prolyl cis-trans isomerase B (cyclophilin B)
MMTMRSPTYRALLATAAVVFWSAVVPSAQAPKRPATPAGPGASGSPAFFTTPLSLDAMRGKQAVVATGLGDIVLALLPESAPNHVGYFMKLAREGAYDGTTFHRVIKYGIIQGGDPLSKDPSKRAVYGTGGLGVLRAEVGAEKHTRGAVSAALRPGNRDSGGAQFFICLADQPVLDGQYTVFARVVEGLEVAQKISEAATDAEGKTIDRIVISSVTIRDTPPPEPEPFAATPVEELSDYAATVETGLGTITIRFFPDRAPNHVRNFLRLAQAGVYDGMTVHRVVPGFVMQTGALSSRGAPLTESQRRLVHALDPEFNATKHARGIVSMARGGEPNSANTSFFVCFGPAPSLDGKYTVFGEVVSGLDVLDRIEKAPVDGETPTPTIPLVTVRLARHGQ